MTIPDMMETIKDLWNMAGTKTKVVIVLAIVLILLAI